MTREGHSMNIEQQMEQIDARLDGRLGLAVVPLDGRAPLAFQASEYYPTASTMKVALLVTLYEQVLQGRIDLNERIAIEESDLRPGGGVLRTFAPGLAPTVRDLATIMIIVSDNTGTDLVFRLAGIENVNASMRRLGLEGINVVLTAHDILYDLVGLSDADIEAMGTTRAIDEFFRRRRESIYNRDTISNSCGLDNDVATPTDLAQLLAMIANEEILTPEACREIVGILKLQQHRQMIPRLLPKSVETASKAGGVETVRADVGIVYASDGPYAICGMTKQLAREADGEDAIAQASRAVYRYRVAGGSQ